MTTTCPKTLQRPVLPSLPTVILKLIEATNDEKKSVKELADIAANDPSICTQILKIANSALINSGQPVKSITQAALNLGISTLRHVAITAGVCQAFSSVEVPGNFSIGDFWNHSLCSALIAKEVVEFLDLPPSVDEVFLSGLLHDIGQLSLIIRQPDMYDRIVQNPRTGQTILESEAEICGWDHTIEGYELVKQWNLPVSIRTAIRYHHEDPGELSESTPLLRIIYLSDISAHYLSGESSIPVSELLEEYRKQEFRLTDKDIEDIFGRVGTILKETARHLGLRVEKGRGPRLKEQDDALDILKERSIDLATLMGVLESLLTVRSQAELHTTMFAAIASLTDIESGLLFRYANGCLRGVCARGTEDDSLASQINIAKLEDSIWSSAFSQGKPIFSRDYFRKRTCRIIDNQMKEYLGGEFLAVGLAAGGDKIGALALKVSPEQWPRIKQGLGLVQLLARELAHVIKGVSYRRLWEKEHLVNEALVNQCPIGIFIVEESGKISYVNPAGKELLGLDSRTLAEDSISRLLDLNMDKIYARYKGVKARRIDKKQVTRPGGKTVWVELQAAHLSIGGSTRLLFFIRDITDSMLLASERQKRALWLEKELVKRTQELKNAQERLIETERMGAASEVARKVVHEVNNPLGIIKNLLKILKIQKETGKIEDKTIDAIGSEIDRVARIVRKLWDFSKGKNAPLSSSKTPSASIGEALSEIESLVGPGLAEKNIRIKSEVDSELPDAAISKDELKQVLINLFKNAEEALGENGEIFIKAYQDDGGAVIEFGDTGPGISGKIKEKIFSPFVTTKGKENSGLGLSVCYGLLQACGGDISLAEKEGFGAFFRIRIPAVSQRGSRGEETL